MPVKIADGSGKANVQKLMQKTEHHPNGRLAGYENPFDPNPNPDFGHAIDKKTGMRTGLTPQEYMRLYAISQMKGNKPCYPQILTEGEQKVIADYVKNPPADLTPQQKDDLAVYTAK